MSHKLQNFDDILSAHAGFMDRLLCAYERRASVREELVQETALALWRALPGFRGESSLKTFIARIAHNIGVSHIRRDARIRSDGDVPDDMADDADDPERQAMKTQQASRLADAVRALPLSLRQATILLLEDFSHKEIADAIGISEGAVAVRLSRARVELAKLMGGS